jgi:hypothetical protein
MLIRLEAAKIVTGLTAYANLSSLYAETRWGKLNTRFKIRKYAKRLSVCMLWQHYLYA